MDLDDSESDISLESAKYPLVPGEALLDFSQTIPVGKNNHTPLIIRHNPIRVAT
jgi:hypothetical protein